MSFDELWAKIAASTLSEAEYAAEVARVKQEGTIVLCRECHQVLTAEEIVYYEDRCERCEGEWATEISAWRRGEEIDPEKAAEFNQSFGVPSPVMH